jgi:hypothetical protein
MLPRLPHSPSAMHVPRSCLVHGHWRELRRTVSLGSLLALYVAASPSGCRIYRDEPPPSREEKKLERSPGAPAAPLGEPGVAAPPGPPTEALNLWVLNRREGDLQPPPGSERGAAPSEGSNAGPTSRALVVLGFGSQHPCAEQLAVAALDLLAASAAPDRVVAELIDAARRFRWPRSEGTFSAILSSSDGRSGGLQAFAAASFSAGALAAAVDRRAILDGHHRRWRNPSEGPPPASEHHPVALPSDCEAPVGGALLGPIGISVLGGRRQFLAAVAGLDSVTDAGIVPPLTQPGVAVAAGSAGAVSVLSGCLTLSHGELAQTIHASPDWHEAATTSRAMSVCPAAHAILTADRAWVASATPVAWAAAERVMSVPPVGAPAEGADAGGVGPSPKAQP